MTDDSVKRLFDTVAPRYGDRQGGYLRIVKTGFQKGDGAEKAFIELLGAEKQLDEKRQKRADAKAKKRADLEEAMEKQKTAKISTIWLEEERTSEAVFPRTSRSKPNRPHRVR
jgi:large subunit ribosomal protein L17